MALQFSVPVRDAMADAFESVVSTSPMLTIRTGAKPANCAAPNQGVVLATLALPSDWMAASSGGTKAKSGTWQDTSADATGTAGHFRIHDTAGTTCHAQGTVTMTGDGGDMQVDNTSFALGQSFTVNSFSFTIGNA
jgi:hypothetical protein